VWPVTFPRATFIVEPLAHVTVMNAGACASLVSVMTKCHSLLLHSWSLRAFARIVIVVLPPVVPVDVDVPVPPEVPVEVPVPPEVPVLAVPLVEVPPEVPVEVELPPVPQLMVKGTNLSPPAAGVLCRTCSV
jgi:hypothetical protein